MKNPKTQKHIGFSTVVLEVAEKKADKYGFTFPEYIRYLVTRDVEDEINDIIIVDEPERSSFVRGIKDHKSGNTRKFKNGKDAAKFLDTL
jgi:hypothetical protein